MASFLVHAVRSRPAPPAIRAYAVQAARWPPPEHNAPRLPYYVPRNTKGAIPVYHDIRNAGTRHLTLIRHVQGNLSALVKDLGNTLHEPGSPEAQRMKIRISNNHVILSGGKWRNEVIKWLVSKGF